MRRIGTGLVGLLAVATLCACLGSGSAAAAGKRKLVEGTVYDTTCSATCSPCPPPCGPVPAPAQSRSDNGCAQTAQRRIIACPLQGGAAETSPPICLPESGCVVYPVYTGEGAVVNVRRRGSATLLATLPIVEGHFDIRLGPGEYILHPYLPEEPCWSGVPSTVHVPARWEGAVSASVDVGNACVAHPDTSK
jgi:hypothetical protein